MSLSSTRIGLKAIAALASATAKLFSSLELAHGGPCDRFLDTGLHVRVTTSDLFIRKNEACIMNRKYKEKSVLRKEGNVYVLDLFVRVPPSVTAPIKYKLTQSIKLL